MKVLNHSVPLYLQAYEEIKKSILNGTIKPGSRLVVSDLANSMKISRTPLREALRQLQKDGFLQQDRLGSTVVELDREDFHELSFCRLCLEKEFIRFVVREMPDEKLKEAEKIVQKAKQSFSIGKRLEVFELNSTFHRILADCCSNRRLAELLKQTRSHLLLYRANVLIHYENISDINNEHTEILEALQERNERKAVEAIEKHAKNDQIRGIKILEENI